jgi:metal-responsive CopG/Arc/MetJ family transcriptional regulator
MPAKVKQKQISVVIDAETLKKIDKLAKANRNRTRARQIRVMLEEAIERGEL